MDGIRNNEPKCHTQLQPKCGKCQGHMTLYIQMSKTKNVRGTPTFAAATAFRPFPHLPLPVPTPAAAAAPDFPAVRKPQSPTPISARL
jgi:hypothetical protein